MSIPMGRRFLYSPVGIFLMGSLACLAAMAGDEAIPAPPDFGAPVVTGEAITFRVGDQGRCDHVDGGDWDLNGKALHIEYAERIDPHENSVFVLINNAASLTGEFSTITVQDDARCVVDYDRAAGRVTARQFVPQRAPAFPSAEGFGKYTVGGRGGRVYHVTTLDDAGPGSFRAACEAEGPRIVVFDVAGTITLASPLKIRHPNITIAGQTAPGDGICIKDYQVNFDAAQIIIRYLRFRPGDEAGKEQDGFGGDGEHVIIDHCSVSWSIDEALSINKTANLTVQWCMATESLYDSIHKKGKHGYGGLWGGPGGSYHHNILAHHSSRNPRASGNRDSGLLDYRNNVIYNWGFNSAYGGELWPRNWVNNYYKPGPATGEEVTHRIFLQKDPRGKMYLAGNFMFGSPKVTADNWRGVDFSPDGEATESTLRVDTPYVVAPVNTDDAETAFTRVLAGAGASLHRDSVDARIIEEIRTGTAHYGRSYGGGGKGIIDSPKDVGGWPDLRSAPAPLDTDQDGMPDIWETEHGLDPTDPTDGPKDRGDGYTQLEGYLNALAP